ncbi:zinc-ribbon domain containing protein [Chloroflexota bacterium]
MALEDKTLTCRECGQEFTFTVGEQEFYLSRNLMNEPGRCPECRAARRQERRGGGYGDSRREFSVVCASCGVETTVPFEPTEGRPVYCKECYLKMKQSGELTTSTD